MIDFEDAAIGTVITDQYLDRGVTFSGGIVAQLGAGQRALQVPDTATPFLELAFAEPVYGFSAWILELQPPPEPDPVQPPESGSDPIDLPPADDNKPSVYPTLHLVDGSSRELAVIHALDAWQELAFMTAIPVERLSLRGSYPADSPPIYFLIDNVSFSETFVPVPGAGLLLLSAASGLLVCRRRRPVAPITP